MTTFAHFCHFARYPPANSQRISFCARVVTLGTGDSWVILVPRVINRARDTAQGRVFCAKERKVQKVVISRKTA